MLTYSGPLRKGQGRFDAVIDSREEIIERGEITEKEMQRERERSGVFESKLHVSIVWLIRQGAWFLGYQGVFKKRHLHVSATIGPRRDSPISLAQPHPILDHTHHATRIAAQLLIVSDVLHTVCGLIFT